MDDLLNCSWLRLISLSVPKWAQCGIIKHFKCWLSVNETDCSTVELSNLFETLRLLYISFIMLRPEGREKLGDLKTFAQM